MNAGIRLKVKEGKYFAKFRIYESKNIHKLF